MSGFDAVVLAGGAGRRLGGVDKPALEIGGRPLLGRVLGAVAGARRRVVVGPDRELPAGVLRCREDPPGGGPVAALAAGLRLTREPTVVVLAADLPDIAGAVPALLGAQDGSDVAVLADADGRVNYLAAAWSRAALLARLDGLGEPAGAPMRRLFAGLDSVLVPDTGGWGADCDSWQDVAAARARHGEGRTPTGE